MSDSSENIGGAPSDSDPRGLPPVADPAVAARAQLRSKLLREDLTPDSFKADWAQALVMCFEQAHAAGLAAKTTSNLLALASHGEKGLINQVRQVLAESLKTVEARIRSVESSALADFGEEVNARSEVAVRAISKTVDELTLRFTELNHKQADLAQLIEQNKLVCAHMSSLLNGLIEQRSFLETQKALKKKSFFGLWK